MASRALLQLGHPAVLWAGANSSSPPAAKRLSLRCVPSFSASPWKKQTSELSSLRSQFWGIKLSPCPPLERPTPRAPAPIQPVARRVCAFTGKKANRANRVSFSNHKTKRQQFVNLQYKKLWWEAGRRYLKLRLSTNALRTIEKNGLDVVAKKAGIDLSKE